MIQNGFYKRFIVCDAKYSYFYSYRIYRYIYGRYDTIGKAKEALPTVRKKFPEAFPVQVIGTEVKRVK